MTQNKRILILGGSGGVGTFAVQYCKKVLGMEIFATCSLHNIELLQQLGATVAIDYHNEQFERTAMKCDIVLDCFPFMHEDRVRNSNILKKSVI